VTQNNQPVPNYIEGEVIDTNWRARGGADLAVRGGNRTADVLYNLPRMGLMAMDGIALVEDRAEIVTRQRPWMAPNCARIVQAVVDKSESAIRGYGNQCRYC
jgi:hypothetical protein